MYTKKNPPWLRHLDFEIMDIVILVCTFIAIQNVRGMNIDSNYDSSDLHICLFIILIDVLVVFLKHPYKDIIQRGYWKEFAIVFKYITYVDFLLVAAMYLEHDAYLLPRLSLFLHWISSIIAVFIFHVIWKESIRRSLEKSASKQIVLFTVREHAVETLHTVLKKKFSSYRITAMVILDDEDVQKDRELVDKEPLLKNVQIIHGNVTGMEYLRQNVVDEIFLDCQYDLNKWDELINAGLSMGAVVNIGFAGLDLNYPNCSTRRFGDKHVLTTTRNQVYSWQLSMKRIVDIIGAIVGLILTGLCSIFIVPAIKVADPGPAIFAQTRIGTNGRPFRFYKFRSMYTDAEERKAELMQHNEMQGLMFKMENDPRIIGSEKGPGKGIGNFLRKTSLDELPQFWNVLKGDMSLVGTRPPTQGEYNQYEIRHKVRLSMKPGITGMWQVSGRSDITDFEEVVRLDTEYIENWSIGLDIKILFKTVLVIFQKKGSK